MAKTIKITPNHYIVNLLKNTIPFGAKTCIFGKIHVEIQYPELDYGAYTITLTHEITRTGIMFNVLNNAESTTFIQSTIDEYGGIWYYAHATIANKKLNIFE